MANVVLVVVVLLAIGFVSTRLSEWVKRSERHVAHEGHVLNWSDLTGLQAVIEVSDELLWVPALLAPVSGTPT